MKSNPSDSYLGRASLLRSPEFPCLLLFLDLVRDFSEGEGLIFWFLGQSSA